MNHPSDAQELVPKRTADAGQLNGPIAPGDLPVKPVIPTVTVPDPRDGAPSLSDRVRSLHLPDQLGQERPRRQWLPWTLCLLFAASTAILGYSVYRQPQPAQQAETGPRTSTTGQAAEAAPGEIVLESKGYIIPAHQIQVSPKVGGLVVKLNFEEGKRVQKGDVLAQLETTDYQAERDRARSAVNAAKQRYLELHRGHREEEIKQAKAELDEAEAHREQLYLEWKRNTGLKGGQAVAVREYEQAHSAYKAADRRVERLRHAYKLMLDGPRVERIEAARAEVLQAEAELTKAEWRLDNCTVRAPVTGTILTKKAEEGNIVNPIAFNISATLCDMADLSDLEVDLTIQERDIAKVKKNQRCRVRSEAFPDRVYEGTVSRLMPIADRAKGAVPVRVKVQVPKDEEGVYLKPEMGAVVSFLKKD